MRTQTIGLILSGFVFAPYAHADFVVTGQPPVASPGSTAAQGTAGAEGPDAAGQGQAVLNEKSHPARPQFIVAEGFGEQVSLRFAVRQIVPRAVRVTYGPGVDPDAAVDWKGGQGWNLVLSHAVKPLGLRLAMTHMAVEIRR